MKSFLLSCLALFFSPIVATLPNGVTFMDKVDHENRDLQTCTTSFEVAGSSFTDEIVISMTVCDLVPGEWVGLYDPAGTPTSPTLFLFLTDFLQPFTSYSVGLSTSVLSSSGSYKFFYNTAAGQSFESSVFTVTI